MSFGIVCPSLNFDFKISSKIRIGSIAVSLILMQWNAFSKQVKAVDGDAGVWGQITYSLAGDGIPGSEEDLPFLYHMNETTVPLSNNQNKNQYRKRSLSNYRNRFLNQKAII